MGVLRGTVLGLANVLVIAIGIGVMARDVDMMPWVVMFGGLPGLAAGVLLGALAQAIATRPPWLRATLLAVPAVGVVFFLASRFEMTEIAPVACIPTVVAALILERWTRRVAPPPPVPVATVMPTGA